MKPCVLVTGATGFLGAALARNLARRGHEVHALVRATSDRSALGGEGVHWIEGDVRDQAEVGRAVAGVVERSGGIAPWVVHSAAVISYRTRDRDLQRAVNVEGTRNVVGACERHRVGRLLHVSSVVAVGHAERGQTLTEDAPWNLAPFRSDYADTKRAAEEIALGAARELDVVAVCPGAIFGRGARGPNTVKFLRSLARRPPPFAPPGAISVVGVEDVAEGIALALERGARGRRYLLTERALELIDAFDLAAHALGVRGPRRVAPRWLWSAIERGARAVDPFVDLAPATPQALRLLGASFRFDSARARDELGWRPRPFDDVLRETVEWIERTGGLDGTT